MCAGKSYQQPTNESFVTGNTVRSVYRVLRGSPRGALRSVDRNPVGRNAPSVKGLSPVKHNCPWWPSNYLAAKATPENHISSVIFGITGVRDHGMLEGLLMKPRRSPRSRSRSSRNIRQDVMFKSETILFGEVRCSHISEEVK